MTWGLQTWRGVAGTIFLFVLLVISIAKVESLPLPGAKPVQADNQARGLKSPLTNETILWSADHETGDLSQWTEGDGGGEYNSGIADAVAATTEAHSGLWGAEMTIRTPFDPTSGTRLFRWAEPRQHAELYYSAWYYFPARLDVAGLGGWLNVMQWKSSTARKNDPFWLVGVYNRADGSMYFDLYDWQNDITYPQTVMNIPVGRWTHLEGYYKIDTNRDNPTGRITVWQDGVQLFDIINVQTAYPYQWGGPNPWDVGWSVNNYGQDLTPSLWTYYVDDAIISTAYIEPKFPHLHFSEANYLINEGSGQAVITVNRTGASDFPLQVNYATSNNTASAGEDYTATSGTLTWAANDLSSKTFTVPIVDDGLSEAGETLKLELSEPGGGASLSAPDFAILTIIDNDSHSSQQTDLTVTQSDLPDPVPPGGQLYYTVRLTNKGPAQATGVTLFDKLPSSLMLASVTPTKGICTGTSLITCYFNTLAQDAAVTVTLAVTPTRIGIITNTVSLIGNEVDPKPANNTASASTTVTTKINKGSVYLPLILH